MAATFTQPSSIFNKPKTVTTPLGQIPTSMLGQFSIQPQTGGGTAIINKQDPLANIFTQQQQAANARTATGQQSGTQNQFTTDPNNPNFLSQSAGQNANQNAGGYISNTDPRISAFYANPNAMVDSALIQNGQDPYNLGGQSATNLQSISDMIDKKMAAQQSQQNAYLTAFTNARQQSGLPTIEQTIQDINSQIAQSNNAYNQGRIGIQETAQLQPLAQGREAILQQQHQADIANLAALQGNATQLYGLAQNQQQAQLGQANLGLGLGTPQYQAQTQLLQQQGQLTQAQAQQAQAQAGYYKSLYGGLTNGGQGFQGGQGISPQFQSASNGSALSQLPTVYQGAVSIDGNGNGFIVQDRIPDVGNSRALALQYAGQLGIPILNTSQAQAIEKIQSSEGAIQILQGYVQQALRGGTTGRIMDFAKSTLNDIFQNSPVLTQLNRARTTAIQEIQGLAGDAPGLRLNAGEINTAAGNLPTATDNLETAMAKITSSLSMLENQRNQLYNIAGGKNMTGSSIGSSNTGWDW